VEGGERVLGEQIELFQITQPGAGSGTSWGTWRAGAGKTSSHSLRFLKRGRARAQAERVEEGEVALVMMPGGEMQDLARRYANTVRRAAPRAPPCPARRGASAPRSPLHRLAAQSGVGDALRRPRRRQRVAAAVGRAGRARCQLGARRCGLCWKWLRAQLAGPACGCQQTRSGANEAPRAEARSGART